MQEPERQDERAQRGDEFEPDGGEQLPKRNEWRGVLRSLVLPVAIVLAVAAVLWQFQGVASDDGRQVVQLDAGQEATGASDEGAPRTGEPAPAFTLPGLQEESLDLRDFRGQPVLVNFWATWCGPCRTEMPLLADFADEHEELVVLAVNLKESRQEVTSFVEQYELDFPVALDGSGDVMDQYRVRGVPSSFFVDRDGVIRAVFFGPLEAADLERLLPSIVAPGEQ